MDDLLYEQILAIALGQPWQPLFDTPISDDAHQALSSFVGKYEIDPSVFLTVSAKNGHLFAQETGFPKFELIPVSTKVAYCKETNTRYLFKRPSEKAGAEMIATTPSLQWTGKSVA